TLAGHVHVGDWAVLGGFTGVHQYCRIGAHALTGIFAAVTKDIPAYVTAAGRPAVPRGINAEGLRRRGFGATRISRIREAYRTIYRQGLKLEEALAILRERAESHEDIRVLLDSVSESSRGLAR
ncbi:MAG: acyl-[acyl-carrier-protein]--UDP-N-acetylglucosamine O-acyltransferase, partial [Rhodospirillaceae bacterium]|nr:acyl-[acyl-carrier-protein]--UDP-N-acetylglucosamine O-acyltransferase [Rhodospirillaceae bacterium]